MPAVDPARLAREIERAFDSADDPAGLAQEVRGLLELYAERARRPGDAPAQALNVPRAVMAALGRALLSEASRHGSALDLASALWSIPLRETRLLAADALAACEDEEAADWAEARAPGTADRAVLEHLATRGIGGWIRRQQASAFARARRWLGAGSDRVREFGLMSLACLIEGGDSEALRQGIVTLADHPGLGTGTERRTFIAVVRALAERSPQETTRYLTDAIRSGSPGLAQVARQVLPHLPVRHRGALEEALARQGVTGIMRPSK